MSKLCPFKVNSIESKQDAWEKQIKTSFGRCEEEGCQMWIPAYDDNNKGIRYQGKCGLAHNNREE